MKKLCLFFLITQCIFFSVQATEQDSQNFRYETFVATQKLVTIARTLARAARDYYGIKIRDGIKKDDKPSFITGQTQVGIYLTHESYPRELCTPWGTVKLFNNPYYTASTPCLFKRFREFVGLHFIKNSAEDEFRKPGIQYFADQRTLTAKGLNRYRETDTKIDSSTGHYSLYKIKTVRYKPLPRAKMRVGKKDGKLCKREWESLEERYRDDSLAQEEFKKFRKEIAQCIFSVLPDQLKSFDPENEQDVILQETFKDLSHKAYQLAVLLTDNSSKPYQYYFAESIAQWLTKSGSNIDPLRNVVQEITIFTWNPKVERFKLLESCSDTNNLINFAEKYLPKNDSEEDDLE